MGYLIRKIPYKGIGWKLQYQSWEGGKQKTKDIPKDQWLSIGFSPSMTIEEARDKVHQIAAQAHLKQHEKRRVKIVERLQKEELVHSAYLPDYDVEDFEQKHLFGRLHEVNDKNSKTLSHWRMAKRILCELQIDPSEWGEQAGKFYDYFSSRHLSPSYVQKVLPILNKWGAFTCKKYKKFFEPIPPPTGREKSRIADSYFDENGEGGVSDPLTPEQLESAKSHLLPKHYNWLYLSVWFGLRPKEIDGLQSTQSKQTWFIDKDSAGTQILWIYQTKLKSISREKRTKPIPCITPEQSIGLDIILSGEFSRPLPKTVHHHFGGQTNCYAGRKGFTDLMLGKGYRLEDISAWLGHTSIERTWKNYKNKQIVSYKKAG